MANLKVMDQNGKDSGEVTLNDKVFGIEPNDNVVFEAIIRQRAGKRQGTSKVKNRSAVRGGGKKPWRQKGTGHARQGSTRAPQWRHGGIVHAPKPRDYSYSLNKKVRRLALKSALSDKVATGNMIVLDELKLEGYKTKTVVDCLKAIGAQKKVLIVLADNNAFAVKSIANIAGAKATQINTINTYDVVNADTLVMVKAAVEKFEEVYA